MTELTRAETRVLRWLEAADFDNTGCRHSQETIAAGAQCTVRTVIRSVKRLQALDLVTVEKERRPHCKWPCNVYHLRHWNPRKRSGVLNVLAARREAKCHAERTAKPSRAQTPVVNPFLTAAVENKRCGRERENGLSRRTWMQEARFHRQRHLTVPDLTCPKCQELAREVEAKDEIIRQYAENHSKLVAEVSGAQEVARAAGKEVTNLKRRLTRQDRESAKLEQVEKVVAHWRSYRPKASKAFGKPGSKSFTIIEKALVLMAEDDHGPVSACCEAIDGLHLAPYQEFDRWYATDGPKRTLRNKVHHALGDEERIARCREVARSARNNSLEAKMRAYEVSGQVHEAWSRALMDELWGQKQTEETGVAEVDGIVVRVDA